MPKQIFTITQTEVFRVPAESAQDAYDNFINSGDNSEFYDHTPVRTLTDEQGNPCDYEES